MGKNLKILILMITLFSFLGCGEKMKDEDFVGVWKAQDGAIVKLERNGVVIIKGINMAMILSNENKFADITGEWKLTTDLNGNQVVEINTDKYNFSFFISGQGVFGNKPPWSLYVFIGDPDELNKYLFTKDE